MESKSQKFGGTDDEKFEDVVYTIHEMMNVTDRRTPRHSIGRAMRTVARQ